MKNLPKAVTEAFDHVKLEFPKGTILRRINGRFYVYVQKMNWLKKERRPKLCSEYIGKITQDGIFVKKAKYVDEISAARAVILANGGKVIMPEESKIKINNTVALDDTERKILMSLSMNSRIHYSKLALLSTLNRKSVGRNVQRLVEKYGILFTEEINLEKLNFTEYMVFAKFMGFKKPAPELLKRSLNQQPRLQLAVLSKGKYDLVLYCVSESTEALTKMLGDIRRNELLADCNARWYVTPLSPSYGFIPLREKFFELLKDRVWHRTKENPRPAPGELKAREFAVLEAFNSDSSASFSKTDLANNLPHGSAYMGYETLITKKEIIKRPTISLTTLNAKYYGVIFVEFINQKLFENSRSGYRRYVITRSGLTDKFSFISDIETPNGMLLILPVFEDGGLERVEQELRELLKGVLVYSLAITKILLGSIPNRIFDNTHSSQYKNLVENGDVIKEESPNYN
ncbi:MAG: hypothetical protein KGH61_01500 [Candidatus Micrarchaeota archaeon]|nr:hypothetical protein [Candidatus Micrarchaeota archaeon]MDE1847606.1 hypothetical protein [Candidatus Micrarchaeota archaeon]MDE1863809.1 hypothetical protein [Candidatus Micrarchaeota archaeon]